MFEFIHEIFEAWILESASSGLGGFKRSLLQSHLEGCARCRGFALDLVEFSHGLEPRLDAPKFSESTSDELHARVMAAYHRESRDERLTLPFARVAGPALRPAFVKAMAMVLLIIAVAVTLSYPLRHANSGEGAGLANVASERPALVLEASPTPTPQTKPEPKIYPTAPPALRTENK